MAKISQVVFTQMWDISNAFDVDPRETRGLQIIFKHHELGCDKKLNIRILETPVLAFKTL